MEEVNEAFNIYDIDQLLLFYNQNIFAKISNEDVNVPSREDQVNTFFTLFDYIVKINKITGEIRIDMYNFLNLYLESYLDSIKYNKTYENDLRYFLNTIKKIYHVMIFDKNIENIFRENFITDKGIYYKILSEYFNISDMLDRVISNEFNSFSQIFNRDYQKLLCYCIELVRNIGHTKDKENFIIFYEYFGVVDDDYETFTNKLTDDINDACNGCFKPSFEEFQIKKSAYIRFTRNGSQYIFDF